MLPDNTVSARIANEPSSERGWNNCPRIQGLPRGIERGNCATGYWKETREERKEHIFYVHNSRNCSCSSNSISTCKCPSVNCTVSYTHREQACSLPPRPSSPKHMHTLYTRSTGKGQIHGVPKGIRWFAHGQEGMPYFKMILTGGSAHYIFRAESQLAKHDSLHSPNLALPLSLARGSSENIKA